MNALDIVRRMLEEEKGATATEYVVMITLVLLVVLATVAALGVQVEGAFDTFVSLFNPGGS